MFIIDQKNNSVSNNAPTHIMAKDVGITDDDNLVLCRKRILIEDYIATCMGFGCMKKSTSRCCGPVMGIILPLTCTADPIVINLGKC